MKYVGFVLLSLLTVTVSSGQSAGLQAKAKAIIAKMTLEQKAKFVVGNGFDIPGVTPQGPIIGQTLDKVAGASGTTFALPALDVPSIVVADGPAGVRIDPIRNKDSAVTYYATAWPIGVLLASSWDTSLVQQVGAAFGNEVKEYGIDVILGPAMNIHRNPLGGRNFEYYAEDPLISGTIASAMVNGIQRNGVGTSAKHFAANNQETNRNSINTIVSERALREIYLKGFEIMVKQSNPWTIMSSYNLLNGTFTSQSNELLTGILRKEWGYKGFIMSDWFGGDNAVAQMKAGNNLLMPGTPNQSKQILDAVKNGTLDEKVLDENIAGILYVVFQSPTYLKYKHSDKPDLKAHAALSRRAATEGMVLLKNNSNTLPISKTTKKIALFGINGFELIAGGTGSGDVNKAYKISLEQGLSGAGYTIDGELKNIYTAYLSAENAKNPKKSFFEEFMHPTPPVTEYSAAADLIDKKAGTADMACIAIGRNAGEGNDRKLAGDYYLTDTEKELIKNVTTAFHAQHKKVVVVLNIGGVMDVMAWRDSPDAILLAWQPGLEGGNAIADVLTGKVNPSGKLTTSFPVAYDDVPSAKNFPGKEFPEKATTGAMGMKLVPAEVIYEEGIYVGYRYYNTFQKVTAYEFGYGLSYTSFSYSSCKLSSNTFTGSITATLTVTNTGKLPGKEVVQFYLTAPGKKMDKPAEELKGFAKTKLLQPGQSQTISYTINARALASFDTERASWIAESGTYIVKAGMSSKNILQSASFDLPAERVVEKVSHLLKPQVAIDELKK